MVNQEDSFILCSFWDGKEIDELSSLCVLVCVGVCVCVSVCVCVLVCVCSSAKRLPKSEPQPAGAGGGRPRGVDLTEAGQPVKAPCCST